MGFSRQEYWSGVPSPSPKRIYRTSQKIRISNVFLSLCCQSPFPRWESQSTYLPRMLSNAVLISGHAVGTAQILIWSYSCVFLPPMSTAIKLVHFLLWELSMTFYIFHRHRVCLVERVDLICSLYSWWEGFGSYSSATLPLGFNCDFISTSARGSSTGVCS